MSTSLFDVNYDLFVRDLSPLLKSYARSIPDELDSEPASLHRLEPLFSPIEISDEGSNGERRKPEPEPKKEYISDEPSDEPSDEEESGKIDRIKKGDEGVLISAQELIEADLDPLDFAVPGLFPKGVSLLAGPPKSGKSLLALNIALAVARGGKALGEIPVQQGNVLVMSLEDGARRTGERIKKMGAEHEEHDESAILEARERLNLTFHWQKFGTDTEEGEKAEGKSLLQLVLGALQKTGEDYRLIVVDTLQRLRRQANAGSNLYVEDYRAMQDFQEIARELDAAVLLNHHTNKLQDTEDPYLRVSGSTGLTAQADTVAVLEGDRIESEARLQVSGRDISGHDLGLRLDTDTLNWGLVGSGHALGMGDVRRRIYDVLKEADGPLSPSDVDDQTEVDYARVKTELGRMVDAKQITKVGRGEYTVKVQKGLFSGQD